MIPEEPSQRNEWKVQLIVEVKVEVEAPMTKISPPTESPESRVQKSRLGLDRGLGLGDLAGWCLALSWVLK